MATEAQINANRQNAQASTGPTSEAGKAVSRLNAVKTGLTSRTMLLSEEDAPIYLKYIASFFTQFSPANEAEHDLVQSIADSEWRIRQIAPLEAGILARARAKLAHLVIHIEDPAQRDAALRAEIYLTYEDQLKAINLQERRLQNQVEKLTGKLKALQGERANARQTEVVQAKKSLELCKLNDIKPDFKTFGFDFSPEELEAYLSTGAKYHALSGGKILNFDFFLKEFRTPDEVIAA